jgi:hypothetical protein
MYFHLFSLIEDRRKSINSLLASSLSNNGSQWSAKGRETILRPVSQLEMRQKAIPFVNLDCGGEVVKTTGSYP